MISSESGNTVGLLTGDRIDFYQRAPWGRAAELLRGEFIEPLSLDGRFDELEQLLDIMQNQDRLAFSDTSQAAVTSNIEVTAAVYNHFKAQGTNEERIAKFEEWFETESVYALAVRSQAYRYDAWKARGSGYSGSVSQQGWETFEEKLTLAAQASSAAMEMPNAPLIVYDNHVESILDRGDELETVDKWCRLASEKFPGEIVPHHSVAFKLLPQWGGEYGDATNFVRSASLMFKRPDSDLVYFKLIARLIPYISLGQKVSWMSYDSAQCSRGMDEAARRGRRVDNAEYNVLRLTQLLTHDIQQRDHVLAHIFKHSPAKNRVVIDGAYQELGAMVSKEFEKFYAEAEKKTKRTQ